MPLELIDHMPESEDWSLSQPPFDWSISYENEHWWERHHYCRSGERWFVQVLENGAEVARVELDDPGGINTSYTDVPALGDERLEIQFFEVPAAVTRGGIGTRVVRALVERHPERRFFAYSDGADGFWGSLGWQPFYDPSPGPPGRTLFIQPAR